MGPGKKVHNNEVVEDKKGYRRCGVYFYISLMVWPENANENRLQKTCEPVFVQNSLIFCT